MSLKSVVLGKDCPEFILDETIGDIFKTTVKTHGHKTAMIFNDRSITYAQLDMWSDEIAIYLQSKGIGKDHSVGLWWPRSLELPVAILGIAKSGAAYVPLDREMPTERVQVVMQEVGAHACFSDALEDTHCPVFQIPAFSGNKSANSFEITALPDDCAYVLYTSGSTGKPKGIPISHRQICHLIRSEQSVINILPEDKIYQGFSVSFDMWCEETWISLSVGATLWIADATTAKSIDELSGILRKEQITIFHAVPSLLAVIDDDIPSIRLINAGGEACTTQVLNRWSKPGYNVFYNSYGPTETTVTATMIALRPGDPITIGHPLPNYNLAVVDDLFNIVPMGTQGQLIISGPGVCDGYVNRPDLTAEKFLDKPETLTEIPGDRIYLTGDAVIMQEDGSIDFRGRLDDQVKLRGYRIELGEIEVKLNQLKQVSAAAVALKKDANQQDQLVGYVALKANADFEDHIARIELAKVLPPYMVPLAIVVMDKMPRLPSGKINRKELPVPQVLLEIKPEEQTQINPDDPLATRVLAGLRHLFPGREINPEADFFMDLGGHSLLAASFSSWLRKEGGIRQASLKDIYTHRPINNLIAEWERSSENAEKNSLKEKEPFHKIPSLRYWICGISQGFSLLIIYGLFAAQIFVPYLGYYYELAKSETDKGDTIWAIITALILFCFIAPTFSLLSIVSKWLLLGRTKEGDYPLWGSYYFRYWLVKTMQSLVPLQFMNGTPLYPFYLRLMGMKMASDAQISAITVGVEDLIEVGSDVSISSGVILNNAWVENGLLKLRKIKIEDHAYIGSGSVISGGTTMETWAELQDLSHLPQGCVMKSGEVWKGSPAEKVDHKTPEELPQPLHVSGLTRKSYGLLYTLLLVIFPIVILAPLIPVIQVLNYMDNQTPDYDFSYFIHVPLLTLMYVCLYTIETTVLSRLLLYNIKPGIYPIFGGIYVRKWLSDQLISTSLIVLHPLFASVYVSAFFRMLGAKIGKNTEISTASNVTHTMLEIGEESFIADAVTLGEEDVRAQRLILDKTYVGNRSFVGNSALIPQGYKLADDMLIGVLSVPPTTEQLQTTPAKDWFGSPAISLPKRQSSGDYPASLTTNPSPGRKVARFIIEGLRILLPETVIICCSVLFIAYCHDLVKDRSIQQIFREIPKLPFYYLFYMGLPAMLVTLLLKWTSVGRFKKEQNPMWTHKVWRSEANTTTYEALAVPFFLEYMKGTPFLPMMLSLFGVKFGKRVWLNTTDITEQDMVSIGDDTALNEDCGPQTHLFEDRVMKVGSVKIGARCSIGSRSIILYDSEIGDDVKLAPLSLVMKGEKLANGTEWIGSPIRLI
jgi:non-ribosomal peptide synthetase-like protein